MDVPGRTDDIPPWAATAQPGRLPEADLERRLEAVEARLDALEAYLSETVEAACRAAVASELQRTGDDLRRAVSELGRLLLRDLDRLTKVLAEHRDTIVERLRTEGPPSGGESAFEEALGAEDESAGPGVDVVHDAASLTGEEGRWRVLPGRGRGRRRKRRRHRGEQG